MTNVFLITVDDLRADHVGYIGYDKNITPSIDRFAHENTSFSQAIATGPMTTLSFPSILFSLYASEFFNQKKYKNCESIASVFRNNGHETAMFNSNPHFKLWGFSKGFDFFEDFLSETSIKRDKYIEKVKKKLVKTLGRDHVLIKNFLKILSHTSSPISLPYANAEMTTEKSLKWIREKKNNDMFCWIHYMDPHYPFLPPDDYLPQKIKEKQKLMANRFHKRAEKYEDIVPEAIIETLVDLYDAEIEYFDVYFGKIIENLKELELYDNSVIVFTADHGELFGDYGRFGHNYDVLYQKQLHVPLIIKTSDKKRKKIERPVSLIDIPHTIMEIIDVNNSIFNGNNIWKNKREYIISEGFKRSSLPSEQKKINRELNWENKMIISCQKDNKKLIIDEIHGRKELYNLENDPEESNNIYNYEEYRKIKFDLEKEIFNHKERITGFKVEKKIIKNKILKLKKSGKI